MAAEAARLNDELTSRLAEESVVAEKRIAAAKAEAVSNLSAAVAEVASVATKKLVGATPSEAEVRNAVAAVTGKRD